MISDAALVGSQNVDQGRCLSFRVVDLLEDLSSNLSYFDSNSQCSTLVEKGVHGLDLDKQLFVRHCALVLLDLHDSLVEQFVNKGHTGLDQEVSRGLHLQCHYLNRLLTSWENNYSLKIRQGCLLQVDLLAEIVQLHLIWLQNLGGLNDCLHIALLLLLLVLE